MHMWYVHMTCTCTCTCRWDELLGTPPHVHTHVHGTRLDLACSLAGTALQPSGDGFGEVKEVSRDGQQAAAEAAAAAVALGGAASGAEALAAAEKDASGLLDAQAAFYKALTDANVEQMSGIWDPTAADDAYVSEVAGKGARVEPWLEG